MDRFDIDLKSKFDLIFKAISNSCVFALLTDQTANCPMTQITLVFLLIISITIIIFSFSTIIATTFIHGICSLFGANLLYLSIERVPEQPPPP